MEGMLKLYSPINELKQIGEDIWIIDGNEIHMSFKLFKVPFTTRMTIVKLDNNKLWIHSPIAFNKELNDKIKELLSLTDLVLLDIKHIDSQKCKALVGFENKLELEFAKYLSDNNIDMWIRQVLIPGYTDDESDLKNLKNFIDTLKTVKRVELLPYDNLGRYKWETLGLEYPMKDVKLPTLEEIQKAKEILNIK